MIEPKKILVIGGHGRVALRTLPLLAEAGHDVHALVRKPEYEPDIVAAGAQPVGTEMLAFAPDHWDGLIEGFDVVIWAAGNGGRYGVEQTYAIDRDAAIAAVDAATRVTHPPRFLMVSFVSSLTREFGPDEPLFHYARAKREADLHLQRSGQDHAILGPGTLHDDDQTRGLRRIDPSSQEALDAQTSRQLVAYVLAHLASVPALPDDRFIAFVDGEDPVESLTTDG